MTKLIPLHDQVLIKRKVEDTVTKGGIVIPGNAQVKSTEGEVLAVGQGRMLENGTLMKLSVKPGDKVLFSKHAGVDVRVGDEDYIVVREDHIIGIYE